MGIRSKLFHMAALILAIGIGAGPVHAQTEAAALCLGKDAETIIAGCTAIIEDSSMHLHIKSIFF